jgi:hypothetical protein
MMCKYIYKETNEYFPEYEHKAVGDFLFIRFFCQAIIGSHSYGLLKGKKKLRREN